MIEPPSACFIIGATDWMAKKLVPQIGGLSLVPVFHRHLLVGMTLVIGGVVDQYGDGPECTGRMGNGGLQSGDVLQVAMLIMWRGQTLGLEPVHQRMSMIIGDVNEGHLSPLAGELDDVLGADPAATAGHEHHFVPQAWILRETIAHGPWLLFGALYLPQRVLDDGRRVSVNGYNQSVFVGRGFLEGCELAVQQRGGHEVSGAMADTLSNQAFGSAQIQHPHVGARAHQDVTVYPFQRRAGNDGGLARRSFGVNRIGDGVQPGPAIIVGQRVTGRHLGHVRRWMKAVALQQGPAQPLRHTGSDSRLATAGDAHHHHDQHRRAVLAGHCFAGGSTWPPKPKRMADRIFSA